MYSAEKRTLILQRKKFYVLKYRIKYQKAVGVKVDDEKESLVSEIAGQIEQKKEKKLRTKAGTKEKIGGKSVKRKKKGYIEYDKDILLDLIREKIEKKELQHISKIGTLRGMPSYRYIKKLWTAGELNEIFGIKPKVYSYTNGEIIKEYYRIREKYEVVTSDIMKRETGICIDSIRTRFGSWNKFQMFLGEQPARKLKRVEHTNEELIKLYREISLKTGKEVYGATFSDLKENGFPYSRSVLSSRFTDMNNLRRLAGFEIKTERVTKYSKQKLKNMLFMNYKKYGRRLTQTEIKMDKDLPNPSIIFNYFQTTEITKVWNEVLGKKK